MKLAQTQSALFSLVTDDGRTWLKPVALVNGGALAPFERVHIYAEMYRLRTRDALREDFPHVATLLGERWDEVADAYVDLEQSTHHSLHRLGHAFASFLARYPPEGAREDLADLAQLEWARSEAFVAEDGPVATPADFQALGEGLASARLTLTASLTALALAHDVDAVWRAMEKKGEPPKPKWRPTHLLVWRKGFDVFHVAVEADELEAIRRARAGERVGPVCEAFAGREDPAQAAFTALGSWLSEQMVARVG